MWKKKVRKEVAFSKQNSNLVRTTVMKNEQEKKAEGNGVITRFVC